MSNHSETTQKTACKICAGDIDQEGFCSDATCIHSNWPQSVDRDFVFEHSAEQIEQHYGVKKRKDNDKRHVKVTVLCTNSDGAPEFHTCSQYCTPDEIYEGVHYALAKENAEFNGYEAPMIAFDVKDPAAHQMSGVHEWMGS